MFEIAMKMLMCLLISALIGAVIGYLIGRMLKCDGSGDSNNDNGINIFKDGEPSILKTKKNLLESKSQEVDVERIDDNNNITVSPTLTDMDIFENKTEISTDESEPELLSSPKNGKADDLKEISGVGLKLEKVLNELGIYHFEQIASWGEKELNWIDSHLVAFKGRARREKWVEQAKVLASGGVTEFSKRVKGGEIDRY